MVSSDGRFTMGEDQYVRRVEDGQIMGRCSGYAAGNFWYQIAARPYDRPSVSGFASLQAAFDAICALV